MTTGEHHKHHHHHHKNHHHKHHRHHAKAPHHPPVNVACGDIQTSSLLPVSLTRPANPLEPVTVIIDAGHGKTTKNGFDPGAVAGGVRESDVTAAEAKAVAAKLRAAGYRVIETNDDKSPKDFTDRCSSLAFRAALAQSQVAGNPGKVVFISLHADSSPNAKASGVHVYSERGNATSARFAETTAAIFDKQGTNAQAATADYYVLRNNPNIPALLIETGFVTSAKDRPLLTSDAYHQQLATNITKAVESIAPVAPRLQMAGRTTSTPMRRI